MLRATHGHLASKNENKQQKNIGRWFEVMTAGTADKVALYWYAEPSVLTHRSWCGDYTQTHACTRTACTQHSHEHMHPRTHATLTRTHAATHARNTHMHTRTHACTHNTHLSRVHHTCTYKRIFLRIRSVSHSIAIYLIWFTNLISQTFCNLFNLIY